jgi:hypothetical protein
MPPELTFFQARRFSNRFWRRKQCAPAQATFKIDATASAEPSFPAFTARAQRTVRRILTIGRQNHTDKRRHCRTSVGAVGDGGPVLSLP